MFVLVSLFVIKGSVSKQYSDGSNADLRFIHGFLLSCSAG
jgi:hypothetical protein